jgi:anti-anti-sigma factor
LIARPELLITTLQRKVYLMANMAITTLSNGITKVQLTGRLDVTSVAGLELKFTASLVPISARAVVDLSGIEFMGSMAVRLFISSAKALKKHNGTLVLFGASTAIQEVLDISGLGAIMPVVPDLEAAVKAAL